MKAICLYSGEKIQYLTREFFAVIDGYVSVFEKENGDTIELIDGEFYFY